MCPTPAKVQLNMSVPSLCEPETAVQSAWIFFSFTFRKTW